ARIVSRWGGPGPHAAGEAGPPGRGGRRRPLPALGGRRLHHGREPDGRRRADERALPLGTGQGPELQALTTGLTVSLPGRRSARPPASRASPPPRPPAARRGRPGRKAA